MELLALAQLCTLASIILVITDMTAVAVSLLV